MEPCPNCFSDTWDGLYCHQCGHTPFVGPAPDEETPFCKKPSEPFISEDQNSHLEICPKCTVKTFNGHSCSSCRYEIPDKAKEVHGQRLSPEEAAEVRKRLGIE